MDAEDNLANLRVASFSYYLKPGEETFAQKIGGRVDDHPAILSQETSFSITPGRTIPSIIKPSQNFNFSNSINSQYDHSLSNRLVPSFNSPHHLNDAQENIVFTVKAPVQDLNAALTLPRTCIRRQVERINSTNGEIGVFGADKYFNMRLDYATSRMKHEHKNEELVDVSGRLKSNLRLGAPSISSEASSWNSQAALIRNLSQNVSQTRPGWARRFFATFGCSGPCLDKGAAYIAENGTGGDNRQGYGEKSSQPGLKRADNDHFFAFPIPKSDQTQNVTVKKQLDQEEKLEEPRASLEVFGSDSTKKGDIPTNLARKLSMLTWDAIPKASNLPTTTTVCEDMTSDSSSDLFEIEDISGAGYQILTTESADNMSAGCMSPPTQYAPSEASIEWSVVTASAADYSSVISDCDEKNIGISGDFIPTNATAGNSRTKNPLSKEAQKSRPGDLLGCKSQKTVNVAEAVHKTRIERY